jgi:hypothetical protein
MIMLKFIDKDTTSQYYRLRRFYSERLRKARNKLAYLDYYNGDHREHRVLTDTIRYYESFFYIENYCMNTDASASVLARSGDFTNFDILLKLPSYNEFGTKKDDVAWMSGGFINHGTISKPDWQLHT